MCAAQEDERYDFPYCAGVLSLQYERAEITATRTARFCLVRLIKASQTRTLHFQTERTKNLDSKN